MIRRALAPVIAAAVVAALPAAASAAQQTASATGIAEVRGATTLVEVYVQVQPGETAREATNAALADQGARRVAPPPTSGGPGFTGLVWDVLPVVQNYNPTGELVAAESLLEATQATWSAVPGSDFAMMSGGTTTRCPSIVQECPGPQRIDGLNDVGWVRLSRGTLGVTWSIIGGAPDEADMALSTRVPWHTGCRDVANSFDTQTVLLHENGHVAGLGHASSTASVMYPFYQGARCSLDLLDQQAIRTLYQPGA
jgi:Matrixin